MAKLKNRSRIVIETPLDAPESRADKARRKLGVTDPFEKRWYEGRSGKRRRIQRTRASQRIRRRSNRRA